MDISIYYIGVWLVKWTVLWIGLFMGTLFVLFMIDVFRNTCSMKGFGKRNISNKPIARSRIDSKEVEHISNRRR